MNSGRLANRLKSRHFTAETRYEATAESFKSEQVELTGGVFQDMAQRYQAGVIIG